VKIGIISIEGFSSGKSNLNDSRVETLKQMFNAPKKVYIQVDVLTEKEKLIDELYKIIGQRDTELEWLKKKFSIFDH